MYTKVIIEFIAIGDFQKLESPVRRHLTTDLSPHAIHMKIMKILYSPEDIKTNQNAAVSLLRVHESHALLNF